LREVSGWVGEPNFGGQATSRVEAPGFASPFHNGFALSEACVKLAEERSDVNTRPGGRGMTRGWRRRYRPLYSAG